MSRFRQLIREVHRRSLWQVLGIYVVGAWIAYEVILGLTEGEVLPDWFPGVAVGLFIVGLPVVLATAFIQEGIGGDDEAGPSSGSASGDAGSAASPPATSAADAGTAADAPARAAESRLDRLFTWRRAIAAGVFAFVLAGLIGVSAAVLAPDEDEEAARRERSIAVLPLENMSPDPDDAYFADGIHEEIITRLFRIGELRTLARVSVLGFDATDRPLPSIADDLGVNYLLVGSVRRAADRSRVSVSLVAPHSGEQLWADTYEATGTDVFAIQASIARNVADALHAELTTGTRESLTTLPTTSAEAYDDYLRARDYHTRNYGRQTLETAIELYERAIELDPDFALARAQLGVAHTQHYWFHYDHSEARLQRAREQIDRALELDPELPQAHLALGRYYYWGRLAYTDALRELEIAGAAAPSDPEIALTRASVHRRAGRWDEAIEAYRETITVDPRYWAGWWNLAETYWLVRRFDEAIEAADRAADAGMNVSDVWTVKANIRLLGLGDARGALATLDSVPTNLATGEYVPDLVRTRAYLLLRDYRTGIERVDSTVVDNQFVVRPPTLLRALLYHHAGDRAAAGAAFDSARGYLEDRLEGRPGDVRVMGALAIALAGLGRDVNALELASAALDSLPPEREAWRGAVRVVDLATVQALTGRRDEAIRNLEWLLANPSPVSRAAVQLDPTWDPLRDDPAFQALLEPDA